MSLTVVGLALGVFGAGVVLLSLGTLIGRPLRGSCGRSCACASGDCRRRRSEVGSAHDMNRKEAGHE